ncbi:hypothetical protein [Gemmata sp.]|uniref:hypothetical protein n=1 Tax=Gemmata sp. TaxID=1914242 RepID=UPI003F72057F
MTALILTEVVRRCDEIAARPKPPAWRTWESGPDAEDREYGPRYSPTWFGEVDEAARVRFLRAVYGLHAAGLVAAVKSEGGRLERVKITDEGRAAAAEMVSQQRPKPSRRKR